MKVTTNTLPLSLGTPMRVTSSQSATHKLLEAGEGGWRQSMSRDSTRKAWSENLRMACLAQLRVVRRRVFQRRTWEVALKSPSTRTNSTLCRLPRPTVRGSFHQPRWCFLTEVSASIRKEAGRRLPAGRIHPWQVPRRLSHRDERARRSNVKEMTPTRTSAPTFCFVVCD